MALYFQAFYFSIDNDKLSENQNYEDVFKNGDKTFYFSVQSRHGWSVDVLSKLLHASGQNNGLNFLTEMKDNYNEQYILISSDLFEQIILEINNLVLWCKNNIDKIGDALGYTDGLDRILGCYSDLIRIEEFIDSTESLLELIDAKKIDENNDGDDFEWLFSYLREIVKMIYRAKKKQQSIVCVSRIC
ncbi:hypothetical protein QSV37_12485 [Acinetobacter sp. VNK23]|uniref:hypothetical protein n=1 Tax=Acinetobacter thutiue TaxID=2998078 RepID=UPI0025762767|nr:hypothetical protein [Acinetobacter thutiue]MDM1021111.1 hypothetical protein [Acinetobacter thutiue]